MYFVNHNSVMLSKILKIVVPLKQNLKKFWPIDHGVYKIGYFDKIGVKMAQKFSIFWITPLYCG